MKAEAAAPLAAAFTSQFGTKAQHFEPVTTLSIQLFIDYSPQ